MPTEEPKVTLADVAGRDRQIGIFMRLMQGQKAVAMRLYDSNAIILAPVNAALTNLSPKPWQATKDEAQATNHDGSDDADAEKLAQKTLEKFVGRHIVPRYPWRAGEKAETLTGRSIWYEEEEGKKVIKPDNILVFVTSEVVSNGEVWMIEGILTPE